MDINILKIANDTKNNKLLEDFNFITKYKNSFCGDEIEITIKLKDNKIKKIGFACKSCIYTQASASLLTKFSINKTLSEMNDLKIFLNKYFSNEGEEIPKKWKMFSKIVNKKNLSRKECLMLPFNALAKINKMM